MEGQFSSTDILQRISAIANKLETKHLFWDTDEDAKALTRYGQAAVPTLIYLLDILNPAQIRVASVVCLGRLNSTPSLTLPALVKCLDDRIDGVSYAASDYLHGNRIIKPVTIDSGAKEAIPALLELICTRATNRRSEVSRILTAIGKHSIVPLIQLLQDDDQQIRSFACHTLGKIGTDAKEAVPQLIKMLGSANAFDRRDAAITIGDIGPEAKEAVPMLNMMLYDENKYLRYTAVTVLGRLGVSARPVIPVLIDLLNDKAEGLYIGCDSLEDPGPALWYFEDQDDEIRRKWSICSTACEALKNISGQNFGYYDQPGWRRWWEGQSPAAYS